jgi:hypothetical protein
MNPLFWVIWIPLLALSNNIQHVTNLLILSTGSHQISTPRMAMVRDLVRPVFQTVCQEHRPVQQPAHQRIKVERGPKNCGRMVRLR